MRIQEITTWAYGLTFVFTGLSASAYTASSYYAGSERAATELHIALDALADELALSSDARTDDVRIYVITGDNSRLVELNADEVEEHRLQSTAAQIKAHGLTATESSLLDAIQRDVGSLDDIEQRAISAYRRGEIVSARELVFGQEHLAIHRSLKEVVAGFRAETALRTRGAVNEAKFKSDFFGALAKAILAMTAMLFLGVLYYVLMRRVSIPLVRMAGIVHRLAQRDYGVDVTTYHRHDEIGEMNEALVTFRESGLERDRLDAERQKDQTTKDLILQMMHRLQACQNRNEVAETLARFLKQIFPNLSGNLLVLDEKRSSLQSAANWGNVPACSENFDKADCWALRRGQPHLSGPCHNDIECHHSSDPKKPRLCVPLVAFGDTIGLLVLEIADGNCECELNDRARLYIELVAENIALALANIELRERLLDLAVRDPLTGLLNRRSLDDAFRRYELTGPSADLVCLMIDIDHFKRFNDQFGHDSGDIVMRHVAQTISKIIGENGSVFRFGGEEFTVLLPDMSYDEALWLAENIRMRISESSLENRGHLLGSVTVSVGGAKLGVDGVTNTLLTKADAALFRAKSHGRNRVEFDFNTSIQSEIQRKTASRQ